jgi:hypothetical protein
MSVSNIRLAFATATSIPLSWGARLAELFAAICNELLHKISVKISVEHGNTDASSRHLFDRQTSLIIPMTIPCSTGKPDRNVRLIIGAAKGLTVPTLRQTELLTVTRNSNVSSEARRAKVKHLTKTWTNTNIIICWKEQVHSGLNDGWIPNWVVSPVNPTELLG